MKTRIGAMTVFAAIVAIGCAKGRERGDAGATAAGATPDQAASTKTAVTPSGDTSAGKAPATGGTKSGAQTSASVRAAGVDSVTMHRGPCHGTCPVYEVTVTSDGNVRFNGELHVAESGVHTATIPAASAASLIAQIKRARLDTMAASYVDRAPKCGAYMTDMPVVELSTRIGGVSRKVTHEYGCTGAPRVLRTLHSKVDEIANTQRWIGAR